MALVIDALLRKAFFNLIDSITARKHQAIAEHVSEYLRTNELESIAKDIVSAASPCVRDLIEGLDNQFCDVEYVYCTLCACA